MSMSETILERKVFEAPLFFDQIDQTNLPLDTIVDLLRLAESKIPPGSKGDALCLEQLLSSILHLIVLYWPSTDSDEIGLDPTIRPPVALRQALAYITFKQGFVENAEDVAGNAGSGLRTLEGLFSKWLGVGIARYAKMTRLKMLMSEMQKTNKPLAALAKLYNFSNATRLKREIADFDFQAAEKLEPRRFYSGLKVP